VKQWLCSAHATEQTAAPSTRKIELLHALEQTPVAKGGGVVVVVKTYTRICEEMRFIALPCSAGEQSAA